MKAIILSGGPGMRLRPLTNTIPKAMVNIGEKPLLWYHIKHLHHHGIDDIHIALSWLPEVIKNYFKDGSKYGVNIKYSVEKEPLGTAGALRNHDSAVEDSLKKETFLVVYGDNLTNFDYTSIIKFHKSKKSFVTVGLYKCTEPWTMGVVETNSDGQITAFVEKPNKDQVKSDLVSAGVLICEPGILNYIPVDTSSDFGFDILPKLLDSNIPLFAFNAESYVQDCGTPERLSKARSDYKKKLVQFDFN